MIWVELQEHPCDGYAVEVRVWYVFKVAICYLTLLSIWARDVKNFGTLFILAWGCAGRVVKEKETLDWELRRGCLCFVGLCFGFSLKEGSWEREREREREKRKAKKMRKNYKWEGVVGVSWLCLHMKSF